MLGADVSPEMLDRARRVTDAPGASYLLADAGTHRFPAAHFDVAISRFGTLARALHPRGAW